MSTGAVPTPATRLDRRILATCCCTVWGAWTCTAVVIPERYMLLHTCDVVLGMEGCVYSLVNPVAFEAN